MDPAPRNHSIAKINLVQSSSHAHAYLTVKNWRENRRRPKYKKQCLQKAGMTPVALRNQIVPQREGKHGDEAAARVQVIERRRFLIFLQASALRRRIALIA